MFKNWLAKTLLNVIINMVILMTLAGYLHTMVQISGIGSAFAASLILSFLNLFVRPILILFSLPATVLTLGFFIFVINAFMLLLTSAIMGPSFELDGFGSALIVAIIMAICQLIIQNFIVKPLRRD
ncbi:phage holin family protein [Sporolactobacillus sp. CPB3-1]|uniref:Phage holin family protein n=1 Tax=Sporolactobacillus mangiferae TaxID=2940498 RepID=A0ABT0MCG6_9BACL|nr:phage holin family protein [Sporolactobacillus mangiferae]MCL1632263.1 phage holin family protein [Sporolactobacillus mangiferae]